MTEETQLLIKYDTDAGSGFELGVLGESFAGMSMVMKDLCDMMGIDGEVEVRTMRIEHASVDVINVIQIALNSPVPFSTPTELFDFLRIASPEMYHEAQNFLSDTFGANKGLNEYFTKYPFNSTVLTTLATMFLPRAVKWTGKQMKKLVTHDPELGEVSKHQARRMRTMAQRGRYIRALKPLAQGSASAIRIEALGVDVPASAVLTENDLGDYLPEDERILPEFENGKLYELTGTVRALQNTRGDVLRVKLNGVDDRYSLVTIHPPDGKSTGDFTDYYQQRVAFTAQVVRRSMFKRPEFVLESMGLDQQELDLALDPST